MSGGVRLDSDVLLRDHEQMPSTIDSDLLTVAADLDADTVELRREIHKDPELGLQLPRTQKRILEALTGLDLQITLGESTTSVVADLDTGRPGPTVLLRGDMDALPLQEDYETPFQSDNEGMMHACGHDSHVAMLVSAAKLLSEQRSEFDGKIRFMFQPGEEGFHGAKYMIEEGVLDVEDGVIGTRGGSLMASADRFEITVNGEGGHASAPHHCVDPIPAAAATITGLHTMVGRSIDPAKAGLVTVAHIEAGTTNNVIPPSAFLEGTIRALDEESARLLVPSRHNSRIPGNGQQRRASRLGARCCRSSSGRKLLGGHASSSARGRGLQLRSAAGTRSHGVHGCVSR